MDLFRRALTLGVAALLWLVTTTASAEPLRIAAASDLQFALAAVIAAFNGPDTRTAIDVSYGSSGKLFTQIQQGAPYDLYFSADTTYPEQLHAAGHTSSTPERYAVGQLVLWSLRNDIPLSLAQLDDPRIRRIAIANPRHAPYGQRAEQAMRAAGIWSAVKEKLVFGENISQTAQFVQTGNADVGVLALSLALSPSLSKQGHYLRVPESLYTPLEQSFVITQHGAMSTQAVRFAAFMRTPAARSIMAAHGFRIPAPSAQMTPSHE